MPSDCNPEATLAKRGTYSPSRTLIALTAALSFWGSVPASVFAANKDYSSFRIGDANADGSINIADPIFLLGNLFLGGLAPECPLLANASTDDLRRGKLELNITDVIASLNYQFLGAGNEGGKNMMGAPYPTTLDCNGNPVYAPICGNALQQIRKKAQDAADGHWAGFERVTSATVAGMKESDLIDLIAASVANAIEAVGYADRLYYRYIGSQADYSDNYLRVWTSTYGQRAPTADEIEKNPAIQGMLAANGITWDRKTYEDLYNSGKAPVRMVMPLPGFPICAMTAGAFLNGLLYGDPSGLPANGDPQCTQAALVASLTPGTYPPSGLEPVPGKLSIADPGPNQFLWLRESGVLAMGLKAAFSDQVAKLANGEKLPSDMESMLIKYTLVGAWGLPGKSDCQIQWMFRAIDKSAQYPADVATAVEWLGKLTDTLTIARDIDPDPSSRGRRTSSFMDRFPGVTRGASISQLARMVNATERIPETTKMLVVAQYGSPTHRWNLHGEMPAQLGLIVEAQAERELRGGTDGEAFSDAVKQAGLYRSGLVPPGPGTGMDKGYARIPKRHNTDYDALSQNRHGYTWVPQEFAFEKAWVAPPPKDEKGVPLSEDKALKTIPTAYLSRGCAFKDKKSGQWITGPIDQARWLSGEIEQVCNPKDSLSKGDPDAAPYTFEHHYRDATEVFQPKPGDTKYPGCEDPNQYCYANTVSPTLVADDFAQRTNEGGLLAPGVEFHDLNKLPPFEATPETAPVGPVKSFNDLPKPHPAYNQEALHTLLTTGEAPLVDAAIGQGMLLMEGLQGIQKSWCEQAKAGKIALPQANTKFLQDLAAVAQAQYDLGANAIGVPPYNLYSDGQRAQARFLAKNLSQVKGSCP